MRLVLRERLEIVRRNTNVNWDIIEQDYLLSWVLYGISNVAELKDTLIFKGGTALKKCYLGDYRFSQDLDFSIQGAHPNQDDLCRFMNRAAHIAMKKLEELGNNVQIECNPYREKRPHPEQQEAFTFSARFPWHRDFHTNVMAEVTLMETVLLKPIQKSIIHGFDEDIDTLINVYPLEEIIAEKIRAILQFSKKIFERGWGRSRVRDYYDLWRILSHYKDLLNHKLIPTLVIDKCRAKDIEFEGVSALFSPKLISIISQDWDRWLGMTVPELPSKDLVINALKEKLDDVFMNRNSTEDQNERS